jgi:hypothetical protein
MARVVLVRALWQECDAIKTLSAGNCARAGFNKGYFSEKDKDRMQRLCGRSGSAATELIVYLESQIPPSKRPKRGKSRKLRRP